MQLPTAPSRKQHGDRFNDGSVHSRSGEKTSISSSASGEKSKNVSHVPCKFFRQSTCQAGDKCPFSHDLDLEQPAVCKYFQKGNCKFGSRCMLAHITPDGRHVNKRNRDLKRRDRRDDDPYSDLTGGSLGSPIEFRGKKEDKSELEKKSVTKYLSSKDVSSKDLISKDLCSKDLSSKEHPSKEPAKEPAKEPTKELNKEVKSDPEATTDSQGSNRIVIKPRKTGSIGSQSSNEGTLVDASSVDMASHILSKYKSSGTRSLSQSLGSPVLMGSAQLGPAQLGSAQLGPSSTASAAIGSPAVIGSSPAAIGTSPAAIGTSPAVIGSPVVMGSPAPPTSAVMSEPNSYPRMRPMEITKGFIPTGSQSDLSEYNYFEGSAIIDDDDDTLDGFNEEEEEGFREQLVPSALEDLLTPLERERRNSRNSHQRSGRVYSSPSSSIRQNPPPFHLRRQSEPLKHGQKENEGVVSADNSDNSRMFRPNLMGRPDLYPLQTTTAVNGLNNNGIGAGIGSHTSVPGVSDLWGPRKIETPFTRAPSFGSPTRPDLKETPNLAGPNLAGPNLNASSLSASSLSASGFLLPIGQPILSPHPSYSGYSHLQQMTGPNDHGMYSSGNSFQYMRPSAPVGSSEPH